MRHSVLIPAIAALSLLALASCQRASIKSAIDAHLSQYPESRVTDIYKDFCQDNLGPGHLIPDARIDLARLDSLIDEGELIMHHSEAYSRAYNPHYRIVASDIFEKELLKSL